MSLKAIREYKILTNISKFTVLVPYVISHTKNPLSRKDALELYLYFSVSRCTYLIEVNPVTQSPSFLSRVQLAVIVKSQCI